MLKKKKFLNVKIQFLKRANLIQPQEHTRKYLALSELCSRSKLFDSQKNDLNYNLKKHSFPI